MNMRYLLIVVMLGLLGQTAQAQSLRPRVPRLTDSVVPVSAVSPSRESGRVVLTADLMESEASDDTLPQPLSAAPPPDPESPSWGQYLTPSNGPPVSQAREYSLIGPPQGILQHSEDQDYNAVIADPNAVLPFDARMGQTIDIFRPDGMAPIGMFGDHTLPAGAAFISYRYLQNWFDHNYDGSHRADVPAGFPFAPTRMAQNSQVALVEYGVTQDLTVMGYLPFQHNQLTSTSATGDYQATFTNPGDIKVMALYVVGRGDRSQSHINLGLSLPVGFLEQQTIIGTVPAPSPIVPNLPYQIRTSSGTYDLLLGYTYRKQTDNWTWGGQVNTVITGGKNTLNYQLGNQFQATAWASRRWTERWSTSARLDGHVIGNIRGADVRLDPTLSPANQTGTQGSQYLNGLLGVNYLLSRPGHRIAEQRLFLESGVPLYQWVDGPQLGQSWLLNVGWGMMF